MDDVRDRVHSLEELARLEAQLVDVAMSVTPSKPDFVP